MTRAKELAIERLSYDDERWEPLRHAPDRYWISDYGRVLSLRYKGNSDRVGVLSAHESDKGYWVTGIRIDGKAHVVSLGVEVAWHFLERPEGYARVVYKDGLHSNTHVSNLRWERAHYLEKLTPAEVRAIRERYSAGYETQEALAFDFEVSPSAISALIGGKTYQHVDQRSKDDG